MRNCLNFNLSLISKSPIQTAVSLINLITVFTNFFFEIPENIFKYLSGKKTSCSLFFRNPVMILFLLSFLILSSVKAGAQGPLIFDSLQHRLKTAKDDSNKVKILLNMD